MTDGNGVRVVMGRNCLPGSGGRDFYVACEGGRFFVMDPMTPPRGPRVVCEAATGRWAIAIAKAMNDPATIYNHANVEARMEWPEATRFDGTVTP